MGQGPALGARLGLPLLLPLSVVLLVVGADLALGEQVLFGLLSTVPLLAAQVSGPRRVLAWGLLCVVASLLLGVRDRAYVDAEAVLAQALRVAFTVLTTALAAGLAARRERTEQRLRGLTDVATATQLAVLRPLPDRVGDWRLAVDYTAAARESRVGGDLYDALDTPAGLLVVVGDVRGKGLPAVRLAALVLGTFRHPRSYEDDPAQVVAALDATVRRHGDPEDFVTAVLAQLRPDGRCRVWNAGHPPPLLVQGGRVTRLPEAAGDPPLGLGAAPSAHEVLLEPGDRLVLHTDGLAEARRPGDGAFFPLEQAAREVGEGDPAQALVRLREAARDWAGGDLQDDVAVLVVARGGPGWS